jgi:outer membrane protein assembly factor BamE (lipoprotein component of BamABCDE complex)
MMAFVVLVGCSKSPEQRTVNAAAKRYGRIEVGMTKHEVVQKLGEPTSKQELRYRWETDAGPEFKVSLELRFDSADKVASVSRTTVSHD